MPKVYFGKTVKYEGKTYPPNTVFECLDKDVEDLKMAGGWLIESKKPVRAVEKEVVPDVSELEELRTMAAELGIHFAKTWGVKRLRTAIGAIQKQK